MRRGYDGDFLTDGDNLVGVSLGSDFTSEHEWGIKKLLKNFGINRNESQFGIEARKITKIPDRLIHSAKKDESYLILPHDTYSEKFTEENIWVKKKQHGCISSELNLYKPRNIPNREPELGKTFVTAWDSETFGIHVKGEDFQKKLEKIYQAFLVKDIAIWLGGHDNPFQNSGLILGIASQVPKIHKQTMYDSDKDYFELKQSASATGLEDFLKKAGKGFFSLSPKWKDKETKTIHWWLNPLEQQIYNSGWFSEEDLRLWVEDKGPVMMVKK